MLNIAFYTIIGAHLSHGRAVMGEVVDHCNALQLQMNFHEFSWKPMKIRSQLDMCVIGRSFLRACSQNFDKEGKRMSILKRLISELRTNWNNYSPRTSDSFLKL